MTDRQTICETRLPLFFLREGLSLGPKSHVPLFKFVCWSLGFLEKGTLPDHDYDGKPRRSKFEKNLNETFALTEIRGDWKYVVDMLGLAASYNRRNICHRCAATQKHGPLGFGQFGLDAAWVSTERSNADFVRTCLPNLCDSLVNPLVFRPDFHVTNVKGDVMHVAHLGVGLYTNGSGMVFLMRSGLLGDGTKENHLKLLWNLFKAWRKANRITVSIPSFRSYCLHDNESQVWYHSKAWHSRIITSFLSSVLCGKSREQPQDEQLGMVANCLYHLAELYNTLEAAPRYVSNVVPRRVV